MVQSQIESTLRDLEVRREQLTGDIDKVDAKIEVLKEVLYAGQPSNNGVTAQSKTEAGSTRRGGKEKSQRSEALHRIILGMGGEFTCADVISKAMSAGYVTTDVHVALQALRRTNRLKIVGSRVNAESGRMVKIYKAGR